MADIQTIPRYTCTPRRAVYNVFNKNDASKRHIITASPDSMLLARSVRNNLHRRKTEYQQNIRYQCFPGIRSRPRQNGVRLSCKSSAARIPASIFNSFHARLKCRTLNPGIPFANERSHSRELKRIYPSKRAVDTLVSGRARRSHPWMTNPKGIAANVSR